MSEDNSRAEHSSELEELVTLVRTQSEQQAELLSRLSEKNEQKQEKDTLEIDLRQVLEECLNRWWIILLSVFLCAVLAIVYCAVTYTPQYTATVKMYVNNDTISISKVSLTTSDLNASKALVSTYAEILKTYYMLDQVGADLENKGLPGYGYESLVKNIKCGSLNQTEIFYISVTDKDYDNAITVVNTIADDFPDQISEIINGSSAKVVDRAQKAKLESPGFAKIIGLAAVIGFIVPVLGIFLAKFVFNDIVDTPQWLRDNYSDIPILAEIPDIEADESGRGYYRKSGSNYYAARKNDSAGNGKE